MTFSFLVLAGFATAFASVVVLTPGVSRLARAFGWVDEPDGRRKLHGMATPSVGGVAIFGGVLLGILLLEFSLNGLALPGTSLPLAAYGGGVAMVMIGLYDDVRGTDFKIKFSLQVAVAAAVVAGGVRLDLNALPVIGGSIPYEAWIAAPLTAFWIVGVTNAVNLIDGVDGLAAGTVAIAFACLAVVYGLAGDLTLALVAAVFVGALGGFLIHNHTPASIFMGDSGSLFLGYAIAVYSIARFGSDDVLFAPAVPILALGLPILDTALSMGRRLINRRPMFSADRDHIHHRMVDRMPVRKAVGVLHGIAALFGVLAIAASWSSWTGLWVTVVAATLLCLGLLLRLGYVRMPYTPPQLSALSPLPVDGGAGEDKLVAHAGDGASYVPDGDLLSDGAPEPSVSY